MKSRSQTKLLILLLGVPFILFFLFQAFDEKSITYFHTVEELLQQKAGQSQRTIRVMGFVKPGSVRWNPKKITLTFALQGADLQEILVSYQGAKPDMFREGQGVVAQGKWNQKKKLFFADQLLVKHSEEYKVERHSKEKLKYYRNLKEQ